MDKYVNLATGVTLEPASPSAEEQLQKDARYQAVKEKPRGKKKEE